MGRLHPDDESVILWLVELRGPQGPPVLAPPEAMTDEPENPLPVQTSVGGRGQPLRLVDGFHDLVGHRHALGSVQA